MSIEELEEILEALLIWEQMEPKTAARTVRNRAIERIQREIYEAKRDLQKQEAS
jgi:hypothetical protein